MTFIEAINRILRMSTLMQEDDDDIVSFSSTQFAATIQIAKQAVQYVVNDLVSDRFLFPEDATGHITAVTGTRTYSLASDFVRFRGARPWLFQLEGASGTDATGEFITEYTGGELQLQKVAPAYTSEQGTPAWFYFTGDRQVGLWQVPDSSVNGKLYRYEYQKDVMPENESDSLPVYSDSQGYALCDMAVRVFGFIYSQQPVNTLRGDDIYANAKSVFVALARKKAPSNKYGYRYG